MKVVSYTSDAQRTGVALGLVFVLVLLANVPGIETNQMLLGALLVLVFGLWYLLGRGAETGVTRGMLVVLGLYLGWMLVSGFFSIQRSASLASFFTAGAYALAFLTGSGTTRNQLGALRTTLVVGASITALAALVQGMVLGRLRISGFIGNAEPLGAFLALALPLAVAEVLARTGRTRWLALVGAGAIAVALLASFSYTAWVGLALGATVVLLRRGGSFGRALGVGGAALVGIIVLLVAVRFASTRDLAASIQVWTTVAPHNIRLSFEQRVGFQESALRMVADHPWVGTGPGTYQDAFPRYTVSVQEQPRYAHNRYLELAAEAGLPSLGLLCTFLYLALRTPSVRLRREPDPTVVALAATVATGVLAAAFDFGMQFPVVAILWWFLLGALGAAYRTERPEAAVRSNRLAPVLTAALAVIVLLRGVSLAGAGAFADKAKLADGNGEYAAARAWWGRSIALDPRSHSYESLGWNWFADRSDPKNLDRAWQVTEREGWWDRDGYFRAHLRGRIALAQDDLPRALRELERALTLDPWFHLNFPYDYAVALRDSGRLVEARAVLTRVLEAYARIEFSSSPTYVSGLTNCATLLGDLYRSQGWDRAAVRAYRHALGYDPAFAPAVDALTALGAELTPAVLY